MHSARVLSMRDAAPLDLPSPATPSARSVGAVPRGGVRPLERGDIPRVAEIFLRTFRDGPSDRTRAVCAAIEATYLGSPSYRSETGSIVHVDPRGRVDGFMGIINIGLRLGDRRLTAGVLSAYMAEGPGANPEIGVRLVRAAVARPLDVVFTDTANRTSLDISRALRFTVLPALSLEWAKVLKPVGLGAHTAARRRPLLRRWMAPPAAAIDAILPARAATAIDRRTIEGTLDRPITPADFVARAGRLVPSDGLRPAWDERELAWLVAQAASRTRNGPLQIREVLDRAGRCIGLYLLYAERGNVGFALQVLMQPGRESQVLGNLIVHAERLGAVAVRGASSPEIIEGLLRQPGVFYRNIMSTVVRTSDPEVMAAIRAGHVRLGGLAGETWARIFGDDFSS